MPHASWHMPHASWLMPHDDYGIRAASARVGAGRRRPIMGLGRSTGGSKAFSDLATRAR